MQYIKSVAELRLEIQQYVAHCFGISNDMSLRILFQGRLDGHHDPFVGSGAISKSGLDNPSCRKTVHIGTMS